MSRNRKKLIQNIKADEVVLDELGNWQTVVNVHKSNGWVTLNYADGTEEEGPNGEYVIRR